MTNKSRIFIAIPIPDELKTFLIEYYIKKLKLKIKNSCKPLKKENIHLTLHFLGDVDNKQLSSLILYCDTYNFGNPFKLKTDNCGCFPNFNKPKVFFSKITDDNNNLNSLYNKLSNALTENNFAIEKRKYKPHITLAYIKNPDLPQINLIKDFSDNCKTDKKYFTVNSFNIYSSELNPQGASHKILKTINLN